jgi:hypothetical protein
MVRALTAGFLILVIWCGADYVLHFSVLAPFYGASPGLWRATPELNVGLIFGVRIALIAAFMATYARYVSPKSVRAGGGFGLLIGLQLGIGVGFGTYIHIPVPMGLAVGWLLGAMIKSGLAGIVVGVALRGDRSPRAELPDGSRA